MSTDTIPSRTNGQIIDATWFNVIQSVLGGNFVPRVSAGSATTEAGSLGDGTFNWLKAFIQSGYWTAGDIKIHHSYNGAAPPGHGWMLCDGRQITQANYEAEHGAGTWNTYVGSSPLANKYLPDFANAGQGRYPMGASTTTADGSVAIPSAGNADHNVNLSHYHTVDPHGHKWYHGTGSQTTSDTTFDSNGNAINVPTSGTTKNAGVGGFASAEYYAGDSNASLDHNPGACDLYTDQVAQPNTTTSLGVNYVAPDSIKVQYYMRII